MNKKLAFMLKSIGIVAVVIALVCAVAIPTVAYWFDSGSASGETENVVVEEFNPNEKYMLFSGVLNQIVDASNVNSMVMTMSEMKTKLSYDSVLKKLCYRENAGDIPFTLDGMMMTGYTGLVSDIIVPSSKKIVVDGDLTEYQIAVTKISNTTFSSAKNFITSITFPASITEIASYTCQNMNKLQNVKIVSDGRIDYSLKIGQNAFACAQKLQKVEFVGDWNVSSKVKVGQFAFLACTSLVDVWFNSTTAYIPTFDNMAIYAVNSALKIHVDSALVSNYQTLFGSVGQVVAI